jgi:hypothetical protein
MIALLEAASQGRRDLKLSAFHEAPIRWAVRTGLGPLLLYTITADSTIATSPLWPLLWGANLTAQVLSGEQFDAMCEILDACAGHVPSITLLKGISIAEQHYPAPHLRPMRDIDFLVEEAALPTVESLLYKLGYRQQSHLPPQFYESHHHRMPFVHPQRGVWVEVHLGLFPSNTRVGAARIFSHEHVASQLRPSTLQGRSISRLSDALQIAYTASHWAFDFNSMGGMVAMLDLIYLMQNMKDTIPWEPLLDWLEGSVAATHLYLMLSYLTKYHLVDVPPEMLHDLSVRQEALDLLNLNLMHTLIDRYVVKGYPGGRLCSVGHLETLWQTLLVPGPPLMNLLRVPWNLFLASRLRSACFELPQMLLTRLTSRQQRPIT